MGIFLGSQGGRRGAGRYSVHVRRSNLPYRASRFVIYRNDSTKKPFIDGGPLLRHYSHLTFGEGLWKGRQPCLESSTRSRASERSSSAQTTTCRRRRSSRCRSWASFPRHRGRCRRGPMHAIIMMMTGTSQAVPPATAPAAAPVTTPLTGNGDDTGNGSGGGSSGAGKRKASSSASRQVSSTPPPQPSRQPCVHSSRLRSSPSRCSTALLLQRVHPEAEGAAEGTTHRGRG